MQLIDGDVLYSPSDLTAAAQCEFAVLRRLDLKLGRVSELPASDDPLLARAADLGDKHEARVLAEFHARFPGDVVEIERPDCLRDGLEQTLAAMGDGAPVIFQAVVLDGDFHGFADFLVRNGAGQYEVTDSKLARHAKVPALLQIAGYADLLRTHGAPIAGNGVLILGNNERSTHDLEPIIPVFRDRRRQLTELVQSHLDAHGPADWEDPAIKACGRCEFCEHEATQRRDVLLVAGMRMTQRSKLRAAGVNTIDDLAERTDLVPQMSARTLENLRAQAALQRAQDADGQVAFELFDPAALANIPAPSPGDIFFDFEGDPMWQAPGENRWGLEYLFGCVTADGSEPQFTPFWAHDRAQERKALIDFLEYVRKRRESFPDMHIYHYAAYEKTALLSLAARHGVGEQEVDDLLREHVLVDLYPIVKGALRISQPSYSLKKLEPLYMGDDERSGDVTNAGDSVVEYARYCEAVEAGDNDTAATLLAGIEKYNEYDCVSTLRLRDWLLARAAEHVVEPHGVPDVAAAPTVDEQDGGAAQDALNAFAEVGPKQERTPEQTAAALLAAAVDYHRRENKPYWWGHYDRLSQPFDEWADSRDAMVADDVVVIEDWHKPKRGNMRRVIKVAGRLNPGSSLERSKSCVVLYDHPHPPDLDDGGPGTRGWKEAEIDGFETLANGQSAFIIDEKAKRGGDTHEDLPVALGPTQPPNAGSLKAAIATLAEEAAQDLPATLRLPGPAGDLLLRRPPQLRPAEALPPVVDGDFVTAITAATLSLDNSTLAVQGPPGTGKTHVGAHVIKALVEDHGWRVGVVSQSHAVVNHLLDGIVEAGVSPDRVGKKERPDGSAWEDVKGSKVAQFLDDHTDGCVIGGTAWDFTNEGRVAPGLLDLLVVDEAGQFSLANTIAVSIAAQRLLLLGDPQQLPEVSQGQHPEPVDGSALGWISSGMTLPTEFGYFLDTTWRMHPDLTRFVSRLAYEDRLTAKIPETTDRDLRTADGDQVPPGLASLPVEHAGNDVSSVEESAAVVESVTEALTWTWRPGHDQATRPIEQTDIIVLAPYNAQIHQIRQDLEAAGFDQVAVGTVDKFQGQQAAVVIVSMTASSPEDVPRGMEFLLSPNRLNVAISRAQWRTTLIHSPALTDFLPTSPSGLADLGRFLSLVQP